MAAPFLWSEHGLRYFAVCHFWRVDPGADILRDGDWLKRHSIREVGMKRLRDLEQEPKPNKDGVVEEELAHPFHSNPTRVARRRAMIDRIRGHAR